MATTETLRLRGWIDHEETKPKLGVDGLFADGVRVHLKSDPGRRFFVAITLPPPNRERQMSEDLARAYQLVALLDFLSEAPAMIQRTPGGNLYAILLDWPW